MLLRSPKLGFRFTFAKWQGLLCMYGVTAESRNKSMDRPLPARVALINQPVGTVRSLATGASAMVLS